MLTAIPKGLSQNNSIRLKKIRRAGLSIEIVSGSSPSRCATRPKSYFEIGSKVQIRSQSAVLAILLAASVTFLYFINPLQQLNWLRCPVNLMTGYYCPGCGSLRAVHALLHGDLLAAVSYNLLAVAALPVLLYFGIRCVVYSSLGRSDPTRISPVRAWTIFWIIIAFTVVRNLHFEPFTFLKP